MRIRERYELAEELRSRYQGSGRVERGQLLDSFCLATGYGRKQVPRAVWTGVPLCAEGLLGGLRLPLFPASPTLPAGSGPDLGET